MTMDPNQKTTPEKSVSDEKISRDTSRNDLERDKVEQAKSANAVTPDSGVNKSEHEDEVKASLNKNDINKSIVDLQQEAEESSPGDEARTEGPYGVQEEGYDESAKAEQ